MLVWESNRKVPCRLLWGFMLAGDKLTHFLTGSTALPESCTPQDCSPETPKCCVCQEGRWTLHLDTLERETVLVCPRNLPQSTSTFRHFCSVAFLSFRVKWVSRMRRKAAPWRPLQTACVGSLLPFYWLCLFYLQELKFVCFFFF